MFKHGFPPEWSTFKKLIWLVGSGIAGASYIWKTVTGSLIHLTDALASPMQKCEVSLEPVQDLHGQDAPYPAGGGVNKFNIDGTKVANKYIAVDGTYTNSDVACIYTDPIPVQPNTTYTVFGNSTENAYIRVAEYTSDDVFVTRSISSYSYYPKVTFTTSANTAFLRISPDTYVAKIQVEQGSGQQLTPYVIAPYSNICPITGWTGCEVWVKDEYDTTLPATLSVTFPDGQTVYGGKYEFVSGNLKPYKEYDSYNGETLTGRWMSSMDKYVAGTTPTIGAQVVDLDGYDTTVQLTPQPISTLAGENNVWSNGNSVEITYKAQAS